MQTLFQHLNEQLEGDLHLDQLHRSIYATDASVYRKTPLGIVFPKNKEDLKTLITFANDNKISLIPRAAGTSLAGQCVGDGLVVDISKYFTKILAFDEFEKTVTVEPGVIRDDLNDFLKPFGLFFGPNTSTSNRCMLGGMVGNNSSGTTSIQYGVTRDKVVSMDTLLSNGSEVTFKELNSNEFRQKTIGVTLENKIYKTVFNELSNKENQLEIQKQYPKKEIHRRNTGYAVDVLLDFVPFGGTKETVNLSKLLCGSEGTLAFTISIKLQLEELPPQHAILVAAHFTSVKESLRAVQTAMKHNLYLCELMDKTVLDCTKNNREQLKNRFFVQGDPEAILLLEVKATTNDDVEKMADALISDLAKKNFGYAHIKLKNNDINKAITLRKAGLGLLGSMITEEKSVACIEDTAVSLKDLPHYIEEFTAMMERHNQKVIYYAHAGAGELHLRPLLNLKKSSDITLFRTITTEVAQLVKKYQGSLSGEHGDGIVRAEFIPFMLGQKNYDLLKRIKSVFDPNYIFNKGKIIDPFKMDESLRYKSDRVEPNITTFLDFNDNNGILNLSEKCNGSGDCRRSSSVHGVMCPSYHATKNEKDSTRARANALREFLTHSEKINKFDHEELKEVFDLCVSCKACASECPSNVDVAILKAEFLHQYQKNNPPKFRDKLFANNERYVQKLRFAPTLLNLINSLSLTKRILGIATQRSIPKISRRTFRDWLHKNAKRHQNTNGKSVYLFIDTFTNNYDVQVGIDTYKLLSQLGYQVKTIDHKESGRSQISKGFLSEAKVLANRNVALFHDKISDFIPLVGMEPSAILTFRDEYLRLADEQELAKKIAKNTYTIEEFIAREIGRGNIRSSQFTKENKQIKIHGHCHQKALSNMEATFKMLHLPTNFEVTILNTGCCGMAGSFGYEKEHYKVSMQMGEENVFKRIKHLNKDVTVAAAGTSCRHQIMDGLQRKAEHPVSIMKKALL